MTNENDSIQTEIAGIKREIRLVQRLLLIVLAGVAALVAKAYF